MQYLKKKNQGGSVYVFYLITVLLTASIYVNTHNVTNTKVTFLFSFSISTVLALLDQLFRKIRTYKLLNSDISIVDTMSGELFEEFLLEHFKKMGYTGYLTRTTADFGADLVIRKDRVSIVVQAKRWKDKVGIDAVQQIIGAIKHYKADYGMVISNSFYTSNAWELAKSNNVTMWDRNKLLEIMNSSKELLERNFPPAPVAENKDDSNICPKCKKTLKLRSGKNGPFLGCSGYPDCKYTRNIEPSNNRMG